jgi:hypothetical protein
MFRNTIVFCGDEGPNLITSLSLFTANHTTETYYSTKSLYYKLNIGLCVLYPSWSAKNTSIVTKGM